MKSYIDVTCSMVREVFDTGKTQCRRLMNPQPDHIGEVGIFNGMWPGEFGFYNEEECIPCPFGHIGDLLWVREPFYVQPELWELNHNEQPLDYVTDTPPGQVEDYVEKSSILMPIWASRITLEITDVSVKQIYKDVHMLDNPWIWVIDFKRE